MSSSRHQTCQSTAEALRLAASKLPAMSAVLGFDGFVDEIIAVVDKRHGPDRYEPVESIAAMARKILGASGESSNYELIVKQRKLGGNGPIMANALASLGLGVTYIGNLGYPDVHLVFREFAGRAKVISIAEPGHTDALEFADGKLMLGKLQTLGDVNWENPAREGRPAPADRLDGRGNPDRHAQLDDAPPRGRDLGQAPRRDPPRRPQSRPDPLRRPRRPREAHPRGPPRAPCTPWLGSRSKST